MRLAVISFTRTGGRLGIRLAQKLRESGAECEACLQPRFFKEITEKPERTWITPLEESLGEWTERQFGQADGLIYIGAAGIAVRAIAPFLQDKLTDPAVVVVDELGRYAISLLSGHVGGANELTGMVAEICGAEPVITTATDVNKKTAIDVWAVRHGLKITDREMAKKISAALLEEKTVGFFSDFFTDEPVPEGYIAGKICDENVWVTVREKPLSGDALWKAYSEAGRVLRLVPQALVVGIGCRKGMAAEKIREVSEQVLSEANLEKCAVEKLASIDLKKEEEGICLLAKEWKVPFLTFSAAELEQIRDNVEESGFVRKVTGTGNVCERAALLAAGDGAKLVVRKHAQNGITVAVAVRNLIR